MKLFIGNLDLRATDEHLLQLFYGFGDVVSARVAKNYATGEGHGYGYVEMLHEAEGAAAMMALAGHSLLDREVLIFQQT